MANTNQLKTASELHGLAVVALTGGDRLGRIEDVIFASVSGQIIGFLVDRGGMFSKAKFLAAAAVQSLGADALTIASEAALADPVQTAAGTLEFAAKSLSGKPVLNESGTVVGKVADVVVDPAALTVPHLLLSTGLVDNTLHGKPHLPLSAIQAIGADSIVVTNAYDPKSLQAHS